MTEWFELEWIVHYKDYLVPTPQPWAGLASTKPHKSTMKPDLGLALLQTEDNTYCCNHNSCVYMQNENRCHLHLNTCAFHFVIQNCISSVTIIMFWVDVVVKVICNLRNDAVAKQFPTKTIHTADNKDVLAVYFQKRSNTAETAFSGEQLY